MDRGGEEMRRVKKERTVMEGPEKKGGCWLRVATAAQSVVNSS